MSSNRPKVYFRADGNSQIGLGHVFRSLALVEMIRAEFDCIFLIRQPLEILQSKIQEIAKLIVLPQPTNELEEAIFIADKYLTGNEIVVLDGYHFVTDYQKNIKAKGSKLVCIDDIYAYHFVADAVINHAGGILPTYYKHDFYTQTFLGLDYLLLRPEFLAIAKEEYSKPNSDAIFICMGGADTHNDTLKVLQKIQEKHPQQKIKCFVVIGQAYLHKTVLQSFVENSSLDIEILRDLSAQQMLNYMQLCPTAVCPPSSVCFEYLSTKGILYLLQTADNQKDVKKYLLNKKLAFDFELEYPLSNPTVIKERLEIQRKVIDGKSGERLLAIFQRLNQEINLEIKIASEEQLYLYFEWANDPNTRKNAFNVEPIPFEHHQAWFSKRIKSKDALLLCFYKDSKAVGQIRFDKIENGIGQISYSVDYEAQGNGYGFSILKLGILYAYSHGFCTQFYGEVRDFNIPSLSVFRKLSFVEHRDIEKEIYTYTLAL